MIKRKARKAIIKDFIEKLDPLYFFNLRKVCRYVKKHGGQAYITEPPVGILLIYKGLQIAMCNDAPTIEIIGVDNLKAPIKLTDEEIQVKDELFNVAYVPYSKRYIKFLGWRWYKITTGRWPWKLEWFFKFTLGLNRAIPPRHIQSEEVLYND